MHQALAVAIAGLEKDTRKIVTDADVRDKWLVQLFDGLRRI